MVGLVGAMVSFADGHELLELAGVEVEAKQAEADFRRYFRVSPPVVRHVILTLKARGFIDREPGRARSIRLRVPRSEFPDLEKPRSAIFPIFGSTNARRHGTFAAPGKPGRPLGTSSGRNC